MATYHAIVNSRQTLINHKAELDQIYGDGAWLKITIQKGKAATMPQKALVHIWFRTYSAYLNRKREKDVTDMDKKAIKISAKSRFYNETQEPWMVEEVPDPFHPDRKSTEMTSIGSWSQGDCYQFLTWLQQTALHDGLVLESIGEHQRLSQDSNRGVVDAE